MEEMRSLRVGGSAASDAKSHDISAAAPPAPEMRPVSDRQHKKHSNNQHPGIENLAISE
jgi:hypothetical protein